MAAQKGVTMNIIDGVWLFVLGCLAVPSMVLSKSPEAKKALDKLVPFQGWIGVISLLWGLYNIIWLIRWLSALGHGVKGIIFFLVFAAFVVCQLVLGFILGIGIVKSFVKDANAQAKLDETLTKVLPYQSTLGLVAIADGILLVVMSFVY